MSKKNTPSARFAIVFMLTLAAISGGVFVAFSTYQRAMFTSRRETSAQNLTGIGAALKAYAANNGGRYPERAALLTQEYLPDEHVLIHPAWPEQPGYVYIPGQRAEDSPQTLLLYENVPEHKRKLGIQALFSDGRIETLKEAEIEIKLKNQEEAWKRTGRVWMPEMMTPRELK